MLHKKKIAIIGSGISGLGLAYMLHQHHDITIYEKNTYIGGHSRTIDITTPSGTIPVDTGFIVCNYRNYPLLTSLFSHIDVPLVPSNMSFAASIDNGWLEYGTKNIQYIFSQKLNLTRIRFWRMLIDIVIFNKKAKQFIDFPPSFTLGHCLDTLKVSHWFKQYYILAIGGAIWSMPFEKMLDFPAQTFIRFFMNHGLLNINNQPTWYTVKGGSREYIQRLTMHFAHHILTNCGATSVVRNANSVSIYDSQNNTKEFDEVVFACHADQVLHILDKPTSKEQAILEKFRYQSNRIVVHSDTSFMPKRKSAWASWVYLSQSQQGNSSNTSLSYWMNNLQPLCTRTPIIVTVNPAHEPKQQHTYNQYFFDHPILNKAAIQAQENIVNIQGTDRLWYCGAYQRYGFHEDGLLSAVRVAQYMGISPSWI